MADIYVKSTAGGSATGADWTNAFLTAAAAAAADAAGDTVYFSQSHSESTASALSLPFAGTIASPTRLICGNDAATPPTTLENAAVIATTGASSITITGACVQINGLKFSSGSSTSSSSITYGVDAGLLDISNSELLLANSSSSSRVYFGSATSNNNTHIRARNVGFKFGNAAQNINLINATLEIDGGYIVSGSTSPTNLFGLTSTSAKIRSSGLDLTNAGAAIAFFSSGVTSTLDAIFRNTKMPASWSGSLFVGSPSVSGARAELHNYSVGTTEYQLLVEDCAGTIKSETTVVRTSGATDGTTAYSWKMTASGGAKSAVPLVTPELPAVWNSATGTSKTITVEIITDSTTNLTNEDVWLEVQYLGTSGTLVSSFASDRKSSPLATAADQDTSSVAWTTTGLTNPLKQKLSVSITPQNDGFIQAKVYLTKVSATVYVDPKLTVA